tara:strand:- start:1873 stop:2082 length:210 start_codon:yes stop_codon:yes gene_type:complete
VTDISKLKRHAQPVEAAPDFKLTMVGSHPRELRESDGVAWQSVLMAGRPADRRRRLVELLTGQPADREG